MAVRQPSAPPPETVAKKLPLGVPRTRRDSSKRKTKASGIAILPCRPALLSVVYYYWSAEFVFGLYKISNAINLLCCFRARIIRVL